MFLCLFSLSLPSIMPLHGNPGDYAWGSRGLDAVITHLLNQLDGAGPAPLTQQQIDAIPEAKISAEQVFHQLKLILILILLVLLLLPNEYFLLPLMTFSCS